MPIVARDSKGRMRLIKRPEQICQLPMIDLIALEHYLWKCTEKSEQPAVTDLLNQIYREVEWRAQENGAAG